MSGEGAAPLAKALARHHLLGVRQPGRYGVFHADAALGPVLLSLGLAGCAVGQVKLPMMTLGPSDTPKASCLTYDDAPAFGDCQGKDAVSIPQNTN